MDSKGQGAFESLFDAFVFAFMFLILLVIFFPIQSALVNSIANTVLGSPNIAQPGTIVLILELLGLIFVALGLVLLVKAALGRKPPFDQGRGVGIGGLGGI